MQPIAAADAAASGSVTVGKRRFLRIIDKAEPPATDLLASGIVHTSCNSSSGSGCSGAAPRGDLRPWLLCAVYTAAAPLLAVGAQLACSSSNSCITATVRHSCWQRCSTCTVLHSLCFILCAAWMSFLLFHVHHTCSGSPSSRTASLWRGWSKCRARRSACAPGGSRRSRCGWRPRHSYSK